MESNPLVKCQPLHAMRVETKAGSGAAMGTASRPQDRRVLGSFRKVSKPLMEKKRRARINLSLEQLRALLEQHCSHQIRKRKLEKADILELSVKYMKSLQHSKQGPPSIQESSDYQAGFWTCLQGVRQLLLSPGAAGGAPAFPARMPLQVAPARPAGERGGGGFSTTDSGPRPALPGCLKASAPKPRALRPPGEPSVPPAGGRGQARGPGERGQQLWRPW